MKTLFPYQKDAKSAIVGTVKKGAHEALIIMATGLGKTVVIASLVQWWFRIKKTPILFLVHLWEAVDQAEKEFREVLGPAVQFQILIGGERFDQNADVVFSTFQTMRGRYRSLKRTAFGLVLVDECHRSKALTYEPIVEYFTPELVVGMTATEERMDGRDVRELFGNPVYEYPLARALADRNLADVEYRVLADNVSQVALRRIEKQLGKGDRQVTRAMIDRSIFLSERLDTIAQMIKKEQKTRRKTIIFCNSRNHAEAVSKYFPEGKTYYSGLPNKLLKQRFLAFKAGEIRTLIVVNKLNEAADVPDADLIIFLRMTESKTIWLQQLGRGLRKTGGKKNVLVLDFVANCDRIRIVGQLANDVQKYLGASDGSIEIHRSGLTFDFETQARNIFDLLERIENLSQAGEDGIFEADGEIWGTINALGRVLGLSNPTIRVNIGSARKRYGKVGKNALYTFYALSDVKKACAHLLKDIFQTGKDGTTRINHETWGTKMALGRLLGISDTTITRHLSGYPKKEAKDTRGRIIWLYRFIDAWEACGHLLKNISRAERDNSFEADGEKWVTILSLTRILKLSDSGIRVRLSSCRRRKGKMPDGRVCWFYPLTDARKACADLLEKLPTIGKERAIEIAGEVWATIPALARKLGFSIPTIRRHAHLCRTKRGRSAGGQEYVLYSLTDMRKACKNAQVHTKKKK